MIKHKRKINRKKISKRNKVYRNPHSDYIYVDDLTKTIITGGENLLSNAINYHHVGKRCKDCNKPYYLCACEGSINIPGHQMIQY